ncbi:MAG: sialidase family protein [Promethearchaeota archaeon]
MIFERSSIFEVDQQHPHCHCSVIQELGNGELMVVWYAGKAEAHKSVGLKASWKEIKDGEWSKPVLIHKTPNRPDGNAIIIEYQEKLHMYFNVVHGLFFPWSNVFLNKMVSDDNGRTWSEPETLLGKGQKGFTVRNKPLLLGSRLIIPTGQETLKLHTSQMLITDDGENYHLSRERIVLEKGGCEQPTITRLGNGDILAYLRTNQGFIYQSTSSDQGETWTKPEKLNLRNPNSALDFVRTENGELVLVWNNTEKGGMKASRKVLNVAYSPDEGKTWPIIKEIERNDDDGRFAYPSIIIGSDKLFHLTYTNRRKNIRYVKFDLEWLKSKSD